MIIDDNKDSQQSGIIQQVVKSKKISELSELSVLQSNAFVLAAVPGVTNYKISLTNLKNAINNEVKNNTETINYISGILKSYSTNVNTNQIKDELLKQISILSGNVYSKTQLDEKLSGIIPNMSNYATRGYVDNKLNTLSGNLYNNIQTVVDKSISGELAKYYNKSDIDNILANSGYITHDLLEQRLSGIVMQEIDLTDYFTKEEVSQLITISISSGKIDMSDYYTKEEVEDLISGIVIPDTSNFATKDELSGLVSTIAGIGLNEFNDKIEFISGQLEILGSILNEINSTDDEDDEINTLSEVSQFLNGYTENTTLQEVIEQAKQDIKDEFSNNYIEYVVLK